MLFFVEGRKPGVKPFEKGENQQQTQPTYGTRPELNSGHCSPMVWYSRTETVMLAVYLQNKCCQKVYKHVLQMLVLVVYAFKIHK